jgi:hypothetical protein
VPVIFVWAWAILIYCWTRTTVNFVYILELDATKTLATYLGMLCTLQLRLSFMFVLFVCIVWLFVCFILDFNLSDIAQIASILSSIWFGALFIFLMMINFEIRLSELIPVAAGMLLIVLAVSSSFFEMLFLLDSVFAN